MHTAPNNERELEVNHLLTGRRRGGGSDSGSEPLPELVVAGPETLFQVTDLRFEGPTARASMPVVPEISGPGGAVSAGSLGVLVDVALGYALVAGRPPGHWSVSTEICVEALAGLSSAHRCLHAEATVLDVDALGGLARGAVFDDAGRLVAVCSQRGRFVPLADGSGDKPADSLPPSVDITGLTELIGTRVQAHLPGLQLAVARAVINPSGNLHGGIALCASDVAAHVATGELERQWITTSIQVSYVRPVPEDVDIVFEARFCHRGRGLAVADVVGSVTGKACTIARVTLQPGG